MMESAQSFISQGAWWMWVFPSMFIVLVILSVNLMVMACGMLSTRTARATCKIKSIYLFRPHYKA